MAELLFEVKSEFVFNKRQIKPPAVIGINNSCICQRFSHCSFRNFMADKLNDIDSFSAFDGNPDNSQIMMFTAAAGGFNVKIGADQIHIGDKRLKSKIGIDHSFDQRGVFNPFIIIFLSLFRPVFAAGLR